MKINNSLKLKLIVCAIFSSFYAGDILTDIKIATAAEDNSRSTLVDGAGYAKISPVNENGIGEWKDIFESYPVKVELPKWNTQEAYKAAEQKEDATPPNGEAHQETAPDANQTAVIDKEGASSTTLSEGLPSVQGQGQGQGQDTKSPTSQIGEASQAVEPTTPSIEGTQPANSGTPADASVGEIANDATSSNVLVAPATSPEVQPEVKFKSTDDSDQHRVSSLEESTIEAGLTPSPDHHNLEPMVIVVPAPPKEPEPVEGPVKEAAAPDVPADTTVYVLEDGSLTDKPLNPAEVRKQINELELLSKYQDIYDLTNIVLQQVNVSPEDRSLFMYDKAGALYNLNRDNLGDAYDEVASAIKRALSYDPKSPLAPAMYYRLGLIELAVNNEEGAKSNFIYLRNNYPESVFSTSTYLDHGKYLFANGDYKGAIKQFQALLDNYYMNIEISDDARDASLFLIRSFIETGDYQSANNVIKFMELRWHDFYKQYPKFLTLVGDVTWRINDIPKARESYLHYYNLVPNANDSDAVLLRLGDLYALDRYFDVANDFYQKAVDGYPDTTAGILSRMRLLEKGAYDNPAVMDMFKVYDHYLQVPFKETYTSLLEKSPNSPLVPLIELKLAMWNLWNGDYDSALSLCSKIVVRDPSSPLSYSARDVALKTFARAVAQSENDNNIGRVRELWDRYPILRTQEDGLDSKSRLALGISQWNQGQSDLALNTIEPFFLGPKIKDYSEPALGLALRILIDYSSWNKIEDLANRVALWELSPPVDAQLKFALALAYESQSNQEKAAKVWIELNKNPQLPPPQQSLAMYYLARYAQSEGDYVTAINLGDAALKMMIDVNKESSDPVLEEKIKNQLQSLLSISDNLDMLDQAIAYTTLALEYADKNSDDYASLLYQLGRLHNRQGDIQGWYQYMQQVANDYPTSLYGQQAASGIKAYELGQQLQPFLPTGGN